MTGAGEGRTRGGALRRQQLRARLARWLDQLYTLPPRIQGVIDTELQQADIIGGWAIIAVSAFLGLLYLAAPKPRDVIGHIEPVLIAVTAFLFSAVMRLRVAYQRPLPRFAVGAFAVLDLIMLYALIWSYHVQYGQAPAFYLKAPTLLFVFVLIAIRALRFEPLSVLTAGIAAALGWGALTAYALLAAPEAARTASYVEALTANRVLVGAELEKIAAILMVTVVLTLAIMRGRRQLVMAATDAAARANLSRFFSPATAAFISASDEGGLKPGTGAIRQAAVVVADIRGFTSLAARRPPNEVMSVLVEYQRCFGQVITAHGGVVDKFLGDGILATFGCAQPSATPAADACRALHAMMAASPAFEQRAGAYLGEPLAVGFAFAAGPMLYGTVGDAARLEFTAIGDAVNLAVKLEKLNKSVGTLALADADSVEQAAREGCTYPVPDVTVYRLDLPGLPEPRSLVGWRRPKGAAENQPV